jgi:predicted methyltransferase
MKGTPAFSNSGGFPMSKILCSLLLLLVSLAGPLALADADSERLAAVLKAQPAAEQARYGWRHPQQTLEFFGIAPGMTVVEALPGGGWYTKVLLPYLGPKGRLIGADYSLDMYRLFGFFNEQQLKDKEGWTEQFTEDASGWAGDDGAAVSAFVLGSLPDDMKGQADAVLFVRALHNLARFEEQGGFLTAALKDAYDALKPGGIVGVVQHRAPDAMSDEWAGGQHGYLKQDFVVKQMEAAGFEFLGASDINQNAKDQPGTDDSVWRLPPTLATSRENPELRAEMEAIGESNRMTLKFRKRE